MVLIHFLFLIQILLTIFIYYKDFFTQMVILDTLDFFAQDFNLMFILVFFQLTFYIIYFFYSRALRYNLFSYYFTVNFFLYLFLAINFFLIIFLQLYMIDILVGLIYLKFYAFTSLKTSYYGLFWFIFHLYDINLACKIYPNICYQWSLEEKLVFIINCMETRGFNEEILNSTDILNLTLLNIEHIDFALVDVYQARWEEYVAQCVKEGIANGRFSHTVKIGLHFLAANGAAVWFILSYIQAMFYMIVIPPR